MDKNIVILLDKEIFTRKRSNLRNLRRFLRIKYMAKQRCFHIKMHNESIWICFQMQISNFKNAYSTTKKTLHFKLADRDVRFFAPGTSSAVLWKACKNHVLHHNISVIWRILFGKIPLSSVIVLLELSCTEFKQNWF